MTDALDLNRIQDAYEAILFHFLVLDTAPGQHANIHQFTDVCVRYRGGYFNAALARLIDEGHVEPVLGGRFLRLQPSGHMLAQS